MFRRVLYATAALAVTTAPSLADEGLRAMAQDYFEPIPLSPPMLEDNIQSAARVNLGHMLFFDPRMSRSGIFSCQSCHNVGIGGVDGLETSIGHGWQQGPRNSPTVFNAVFNIAQFWDGHQPAQSFVPAQLVTVRSGRKPVKRPIASIPSSNRLASPRNLLMR